MASEWPIVRLGDHCHKIGSGATPRGGKSTYLERGEFALIRSQNVYNDGFRPDGLAFISPDQAAALNGASVEADDVLVNITGDSVARVCQVPSSVIPARVNQHVAIVRPDSDEFDPRFIRYLLTAPEQQERLLSLASVGATRPALTKGMLEQLKIPKPPMRVQREVVEPLWAIDQRIDALRQANATLESIAQALFKSWFVDFDPVRAKAEGRAPEEMDAATAALFPADFEGSELGDIPKGWRVASLQEHITAERGLSYKGTGLAEDGVPMHNLNSVLEGGGYKYSGIKYYRGDYKDRHIAQPGDIIVANTEQGHHHRLIGFPAVVPRSFETGIYSHHLYRVRIQEHSGLTPEWLYQCLMGSAVRDQIIGCANGSTVNMLKPAGLQIPRFAVPSGELCAAFDAIANPIREIAEANVARIGNLSALRDILLPRLISGKLRLPDAEVEIEAAFT